MKKMLVLLSLLIIAIFLMGCAPKESTDGALAGEAVKKSAVNKPAVKICDADMQFKIIPNKDTVHSSLCYNGEWLKCWNPLVYKGKKYGVWGEEKPGVKTYGPYDGTQPYPTGGDYFCIPTTGGHFIICDTGNWWDTSNIDDWKFLVAENGLGGSCDKKTNTFVQGKGLPKNLNLPKTKTITIPDEKENPTIKDICK